MTLEEIDDYIHKVRTGTGGLTLSHLFGVLTEYREDKLMLIDAETRLDESRKMVDEQRQILERRGPISTR